MKNTHHFAKVALALSLWISAAALHAEPFLYVSASAGSRLLKVDLGAGVVTDLGPFNQPGCFAVAINPQGGIYTATQGSPAGSPHPQLARVDATTGGAAPFGVNLSPEIFMGIGFTPDGELYGVNATSGTPDDGSLFQFDPATGTAAKVKVTGSCGRIMDLAVHPDGTLYGVDDWSLFRINPNTGEATLVVTTAHTRIMGLAIDDDGNFYVSEIKPTTPLLKLDPVTGATTSVPGVILDRPHGLEFIPTPRSGILEIAFAKSPVTAEDWMGSVDTDLDGSPDGNLAYHTTTARAEGKTVHMHGEYTVETDFYKFTADMSLELNQTTGSIRGSGLITDGWLDGARVHLEAELVPGGSAGILRLMPGSAD
ncbi:MAG TPA: hypothetical protein VHP83_23850 [Aggregatilineaceae bacterium]|nr:hypothetical protein [Aggregatilineaceae bacterium]